MIALAHPRPQGPAPAARRGAGADAGETLIELMVAVLIMGTAIVAILGAITTMIVTAGQHRGVVRTTNEATNVAELIQGDDMPYVDCATSYSPTYTTPTGYTITIAKPRYLTSRGGPTVAPPYTPAFQDTCPGTDQGLQEITVTAKASARDGGVTQRVTIVKRKPT